MTRGWCQDSAIGIAADAVGDVQVCGFTDGANFSEFDPANLQQGWDAPSLKEALRATIQ